MAKGPAPPPPAGAVPDAAQLAALALRLDAGLGAIEQWTKAREDEAQTLEAVVGAVNGLAGTVETLTEEVKKLGEATRKEPSKSGEELGKQLAVLTAAVNRCGNEVRALVLLQREKAGG